MALAEICRSADRDPMSSRERWVITGATGLVGAAVSVAAAAAGVDVVRTSSSGDAGSIRCDIRNKRALFRLLDAKSPDRVIHLAALSKPGAVAADLALARNINVSATASITEWC